MAGLKASVAERNKLNRKYPFVTKSYEVNHTNLVSPTQLMMEGGYDHVEPLILTQQRVRTYARPVGSVILLEFTGERPSQGLVSHIIKLNDLKPEGLYTLAAFGKKFPDEQRHTSIVQVGEVDSDDVVTDSMDWEYQKRHPGRGLPVGGIYYGASLCMGPEGRCLLFTSLWQAVCMIAHGNSLFHHKNARYIASGK